MKQLGSHSMQRIYGSVRRFEIPFEFFVNCPTDINCQPSIRLKKHSHCLQPKDKRLIDVKVKTCYVKLISEKITKLNYIFDRYDRSVRCVNSRKTRMKQTPFLTYLKIESNKRNSTCV